MKFSLAFASMALAADNQSPVISLDLSAMDCGTCYNTGTRASRDNNQNVGLTLTPNTSDGRVRSYADECEVDANQVSGTACTLPVVTAADHHNSGPDVTFWTDTYVYATAASHTDLWVCEASSVANKSCPTNMSSSVRSENILHYQAKDLSNNYAESISFTMIYTDSAAPECSDLSETPSCKADGDEAGLTYTGGNIAAELSWTVCDDASNQITWAPDTMSTYDEVDGFLRATDSLMTRVLSNGPYDTISTTGVIEPTTLAGLSIQTTYDYSITSQDFASIFGTDSVNNMYSESGTLSVNDSVKPVISVGTLADAECGFQVTAPMETVSYTDCFDDFSLAAIGRTKSVIDAQINYSPNLECYQGRGVETSNHSVSSDGYGMEIVYTVSDHFGNPADPVRRDMTCHDTIKPTLYITQLQSRSTETLDHGDGIIDFCSGGITNATEDGTHSHCTSFNHGDQFTTYHHVTDSTTFELAEGYDTSMNGITIQHSAGSEADYALPQELTTEGVGYSCIDICSATTSTATWTVACNNPVPGTAFSENTVGTFYLRYSCVDAASNDMTACRTFINLDKTRPVLNVVDQANDSSGYFYVDMHPTESFTDEGATCTDVVDGNLSRDIVVSGDLVDRTTEGTYIITYDCSDLAGNAALSNTRSVVVRAAVCPYCSQITDPNVTIEASFPYTETDVTCTDTTNEIALTPNKECSASVGSCKDDGVDVEQTGVFTITYSATDSYGNGVGGNNVGGILCHSDVEDSQTDPQPWQTRTKTVTVEDTGFGYGAQGGITLKYKGTILHDAHETGMPSGYMAESTSSLNGWVIGAVASAVSGVAILGYASTRKSNTATSVPV